MLDHEGVRSSRCKRCRVRARARGWAKDACAASRRSDHGSQEQRRRSSVRRRSEGLRGLMHGQADRRQSIRALGAPHGTASDVSPGDSGPSVTNKALLLSVFTALCLSSCARSQGVRLIGPYESHASPKSLAQQLAKLNVTWQEIERSGTEEGDARPPFSIIRWRHDGWMIFGEPGDVEITFFNERLTAVSWFPARDPSDSEIVGLCDECPKPRRGVDFQGRRYIAWEDEVLTEEMNAWIRDHS